MKHHILICLLFACLLPLQLWAQENTIEVEGTVKDASGATMPGVSVYIKNSPGIGVATDIDGNFKIKVQKSDCSGKGGKNCQSYQIANQKRSAEHAHGNEDFQPNGLYSFDDEQVDKTEHSADSAADCPADHGHDPAECRNISPNQNEKKRQYGQRDFVPCYAWRQAYFFCRRLQVRACQIVAADGKLFAARQNKIFFGNFL